MTNRDKINKISNSGLADLLGRTFGIGKCDFCCYEKEGCSGKSCFDAIEMWLSAPCANKPENPPAENNPPADKVDKPQQEAHDNVNYPKHYNREGAMECIREMVVVFGYEATINFCKLNAWKYRYRASEKNGAEDMAKSDWYVKMVEELTAEAGYF